MAIAEKLYRVSYEEGNEKVSDLYRFEMDESGAFKYGNCHCLNLFRGEEIVESWDVRYDKRFYDEETFFKYIDDFAKEIFRKDAEVWGRVR